MTEDRFLVTIHSSGPEETARLGRVLGTFLERGHRRPRGRSRNGEDLPHVGDRPGAGRAGGVFHHQPHLHPHQRIPRADPLFHLDMYRLSGVADLDDMGMDEYFYGNGVMVIEWAEKITDLLPEKTVHVFLHHGGGDKRKIEISAKSDKRAKLRKALDEGGFR